MNVLLVSHTKTQHLLCLKKKKKNPSVRIADEVKLKKISIYDIASFKSY